MCVCVCVRKGPSHSGLTMAHMCRHLTGSVASCAGWVGLIVATSTNDWVTTCDYSVATCVRLDELGTQGLWAECVIAPALYHCVSLNQILTLPGKTLRKERERKKLNG